MFWVRVHDLGEHVFVTVVDKELLGKRFKEGDIILDINEDFFKGELLDEELALARMEAATSLYVIGKRAVKLAVEGEFIHPAAIKKVEGVPYAQMLLLYA
ncbi:hypothetical protein IPA_06440 [Ignicoccus pacificus DSM 13166]|uniref:DUF424 domain-containing protein n=1 Tax=Ignicoccus pacificus DSM 13166 TaxID=940294 RepID=A0A977KBF4_9CREN|nr:hypothetical protein IPA_06440 [Ignicoccus pacificus DSM 13166]